jgi:2-polyprenyl-6-methoxyphenol hydroxylase-like FAD-dependent oxidoreductase
MMQKDTDVLIVGAGPGGLALALSLHQIGVDCRVYEATPELKPIGAGINLLPHAVRELDELGLVQVLDKVGIRTTGSAFFNKFGQLIYKEPAGEAAGYPWPQFSIHRGDFQLALAGVLRDRAGPSSIATGHVFKSFEQQSDFVVAHFDDPDGAARPPVRASLIVGCDGIHSNVRKKLYPSEGEPVYGGITSWRGVVPFEPLLDGSHTMFAGWLSVGKLTAYPVRNSIDGAGRQLMNWVTSLLRPRPPSFDWTRRAKLEDFFEPFSTWKFDWFDVPKMLESTETHLVFPVIDRDPVPTWTFGRATLLGDAAHPMYPRGSNGAGQAVLDARYLAGCLKRRGVCPDALAEYDAERVPATSNIVLMNRKNPPDVMLREVEVRSGGKPFKQISDVISESELREISNRYKSIAGFEIEQLKKRQALV